jgi:Asp-tRNA(Asn)/Glu-tRNA(Gln) amidotransferase A subunit family amidase
MNNPIEYDLKSVNLPRMAGGILKLFAGLLDNPATRGLLLGSLLNSGGITRFRQLQVDSPPTYLPLYPCSPEVVPEEGSRKINSLADLIESGSYPRSNSYLNVGDYASAYRQGMATPEDVAIYILEAVAQDRKSSSPMNMMIAQDRDDVLAQAHASSLRHQEGKPLSILDGVPVAVKDEVDQVPYPTTVGTRFLGITPAQDDSTVVARLRAAGALLIGKTNMHEIGIGVTGLNPHHGTVRNPYSINHHTGGSSSGSAAAVASGLCPIAIGADGGGSIRIPSAFCGVVGLKPTYGRVSEFGAAPLTWSMGHLGPIANNVLDAALGYAIIAGADSKDPNTLFQPRLNLDKIIDPDLSDLTLGVYWQWFRHASASIVEACENMLANLQKQGAKIKEIEIPGLEAARVAHIITITGEMVTALDRYDRQHRKDYGLDARLNLSLARSFYARDYIKAQRVRTQLIESLQSTFQGVNAIITPTTAVVAPPIRPDAQPDGESDLTTLTEIMRYTTVANLTGHPAISFPAGYDQDNLPIGVQAIGRPWEEHVLLRIAYVAGDLVERKPPQVLYRPLKV